MKNMEPAGIFFQQNRHKFQYVGEKFLQKAQPSNRNRINFILLENDRSGFPSFKKIFPIVGNQSSNIPTKKLKIYIVGAARKNPPTTRIKVCFVGKFIKILEITSNKLKKKHVK